MESGTSGLRFPLVRATPAALALLLAGCSSFPASMNPVSWWHDLQGGKIAEERPPPPGADQPYPNLSTVPPKPADPDRAALANIANALIADRTNAQRMAAAAPIADPSSPSASPGLFGKGTIPPPPPPSPPGTETAKASLPAVEAPPAPPTPAAPAPGPSASSGPVPAPAKAPIGAVQSAPLELPAASAQPAPEPVPAAPQSAAPPPPSASPPAAPATAAASPPAAPPSNQASAPSGALAALGQPSSSAAQNAPLAPPGAAAQAPAAAAPPPPLPTVPPPPPNVGIGPTASAVIASAKPPPSPNTVSITFLGGSATLSPSATDALKQLSARRGKGIIAVTGYGEAVSSDPDAQSKALTLGMTRAQAIATALTAAGVPASAVQVDAEAIGRGGTARLVQ
jgi:outer membrane protein OmpA-like peptidoglycan-associated protein